MSSRILINSTLTGVRVALLEGDEPVEIFVESRDQAGITGNIYWGRVVRVLPGMQAAFVDIGLGRTAFLYVDDALTGEAGRAAHFGAAAKSESTLARTPLSQRGFRVGPQADIAQVVKAGQKLLVQVQKEPLGTKGARITRQMTLPGRYTVFLPMAAHIGVSHRIEDAGERARLMELLKPLAPAGMGFVARTSAATAEPAAIVREAESLIALWQHIERQSGLRTGIGLVFAELDLAPRTCREFIDATTTHVYVDREKTYEELRLFLAEVMPHAPTQVVYYQEPEDIFVRFGVSAKIALALARRVNLSSGGYLVFDYAEAMCVIDVNSGRFVGRADLEQTVTALNVEAAEAIAKQLRLRNIGGIIAIDFVDMVKAKNRQKVLQALADALMRDRARTTIVRMSEIGLVEMTRKRVRESLPHLLCEPCPTCQGRAAIRRADTMVEEILRHVRRVLNESPTPLVIINVAPEVERAALGSHVAAVGELETTREAQVVFVGREGMHREHYEIMNAQRPGSVVTPPSLGLQV